MQLEQIFKLAVRRNEQSQMDLNTFFEALEEVCNKLYTNRKSESLV